MCVHGGVLYKILILISFFIPFVSYAQPSQGWDPFRPLERAILHSADEISMSLDGINRTISIKADILFSLIQQYGPDLGQTAESLNFIANGFPSLITSGIEIASSVSSFAEVTQTAESYMPAFNNSAVIVGSSLTEIANEMTYFRSLIEDQNTKIILMTTGAILGSAAILYIGDCAIKIGKTMFRGGKSFYQWCKRTQTNSFDRDQQNSSSNSQNSELNIRLNVQDQYSEAEILLEDSIFDVSRPRIGSNEADRQPGLPSMPYN